MAVRRTTNTNYRLRGDKSNREEGNWFIYNIRLDKFHDVFSLEDTYFSCRSPGFARRSLFWVFSRYHLLRHNFSSYDPWKTKSKPSFTNIVAREDVIAVRHLWSYRRVHSHVSKTEQHYKCTGKIESVYIRKESNSHRFGLGHNMAAASDFGTPT